MDAPQIMDQRGFSLFELIVVLIVIGIIAAEGLKYYGDAMDDSRRVGVQTLANNFTAAVSSVHAQWYLGGKPDRVDVDNITVYVNEYGWPVGTEATIEQDSAACAQVWQSILQNPAQASVEGKSQLGSRRYHISALDSTTCRYELLTNPKGTHYFDYSTYTGQVYAEVPPLQ